MNVKTLTAPGRVANTWCGGRYHQPEQSAARVSPCVLPTNLPAHEGLGTTDIFSRRLFSRALGRSRTARVVDVSMGISPRNVRSEGVAPCKYQRLPNTKKHASENKVAGMHNAIKKARSATMCSAY